MPASNPPAAESDDRFPSGRWQGYFLQRSLGETKRRMELDLTFREGRITGDGRDGVGPFTIKGRYDVADGTCFWTKRYPAHDVFYKGYAEGKGIWGTWEIELNDRDGFRIWPKGSGEGEEQSDRREETPPVTFEEDVLEREPLVTGR